MYVVVMSILMACQNIVKSSRLYKSEHYLRKFDVGRNEIICSVKFELVSTNTVPVVQLYILLYLSVHYKGAKTA
jgi:hypothetical protein